MALTHARAKEIAEFGALLATEAKALLWRVEEFLKANSAASIDWGNASKPEILNEDVAGNLDGLHFTRQELSNAIGSLDSIRKVLRNEAPPQGDHLGNLEHLAQVEA